MKKSTFTNLIIYTVGGLLFALGMCMCLLPEWNSFNSGFICTVCGAIILTVRSVIIWIRSGTKIKINWKMTGKILYSVFALLILGFGMCMILVWNQMISGILIGILGIVLLLMLIPMFFGLK